MGPVYAQDIEDIKGGVGTDMAVTKIHPIKSTLKKALDYIENPGKTDNKLLVSSFACSYETADIEFEMLLAQAIPERATIWPTT